jgi:hypothetical protein
VVAQIDDLLDASPINILQDSFKRPAIPMNICNNGEMRERFFVHRTILSNTPQSDGFALL